ncbi:MAG: hypothetical protein HFG56_08865 [Lachnospiraceae bacterium]|jgi:hypothetical protein|nr:hypothetical protein [Lachnospiraceae bacterium]
MGLDTVKVMVLLQRKYNAIREIGRLTRDLGEAFTRNDDISAAMLLEMRAEEMAKVDACIGELWELGETDRSVLGQLRVLLTADPKNRVGETPEEKKIYDIRRRTQTMLDELKEEDRKLNRRVTGEKSFYKTSREERRPIKV